jgi:hypothetical protein
MSQKLTYGDGNLQTQQGKMANGNRCICITKHDQGRTITTIEAQLAELDAILAGIAENLER